MSSLDAFVESLIQEQDKLVQMGVIQTSKNQALLMIESINAQEIGKHKGKEPKATDSKPKENQRSSDGASSSKKKEEIQEDELSLLYERLSSRVSVHEEDHRTTVNTL